MGLQRFEVSCRIGYIKLVDKLIEYEKAHKLSYFPALDYYAAHNAFDPDLFDAVKNISWVVTSLVHNEINSKLRGVFSSIKFEAIRILADTLPNIRTTDLNYCDKLLEHYNMSTVKVNLALTTIQKTDDKESIAILAKNLAYQWLHKSFDKLEITSSKLVK